VIEEMQKELIDAGATLKEAARKLAEEKFYTILGREIVVRGNVIDDKFFGLILKAFTWDDLDFKREIAMERAQLKEALKMLEGGEG
jgi:replication factor A1